MENRNVKKGDFVKIKIEYQLGGGFQNFKTTYVE